MSVLIVTSVGDIVIDLHTDRCPLTTKNFLKLCKMKYYNGCLFHKVETNFMAQTGDPTGTGNGGDSVYKFLYGDQARLFDDEIHPDLKHSKTGTVAMASAGKNCNASQFYFSLRDELDYLDGKHTVFGIVEEQEGLDTLAKISEAFVDENGRPLKNIRIKHTYILDDPFSDPAQLAEFIPEKSPEGKPNDEIAEERLEDNWVPMEETLGSAELEEAIRSKEAHTNAAILESIGDIPDAEVKPPENVLFVCKLNPVTQDEDLHTIFSRFGTVVSADIIRDFKTGDSLCYAFIEFETQEACELAYFKMDNTLIDDRRIHVDFSQSVSRLWSQYRLGKRTQNKGGGCFKCGDLGHIAKYCDGESDNKQEPSKYALKEGNTQRGGGLQSYDMVFDGDDLGTMGSSEDETKTRVKKQKVYYSHEDSKQRDSDRRNSESRSYKRGHEESEPRKQDGWQASRTNEEHRDRGSERHVRDRALRGRDTKEVHQREREPQKHYDRSKHVKSDDKHRSADDDEHSKDRNKDAASRKREVEDKHVTLHGRRDEENGKRIRDFTIDSSREKFEDKRKGEERKRHESDRSRRDSEEHLRKESSQHRHDQRGRHDERYEHRRTEDRGHHDRRSREDRR